MRKVDLEFLHDFLVRLDDRLDDLAQISARHDENLKQHMRRSEQNEESIEMLKEHVNRVNGVAAFIAFVGIVVGIWATVKGL